MLKKSIISTLAHYEAERGLPLSAFEIYRYLHKLNNTDLYKLKDVLEIIEGLVQNKTIGFINGFYFLNPGNKVDKYKERISRDKISIKKWKKARNIIWLMQLVPFIRSIAVAGSLSMNNTNKSSDIDLFIITKAKRIWMVRTFSMLLTQFIGKRRHNKKINNKICLNYYLAEDILPEIKNIASANVFLRSIPVSGVSVYNSFFEKNINWMQGCFNKAILIYAKKREIKNSNLLCLIKNFFEFVFSGSFGDFVEKFFSTWQTERINKKIEKDNNVSNLIFTDNILMFHYPNPRNKDVLEKYNNLMRSYP